MSKQADNRANHRDAASILRELYPEPYRIKVTRPALRSRFVALPSASATRLLLPADARLGPATLRHARRALGLRSRLLTTSVGLALRTGAAQLVTSGFTVESASHADSIDRVLESALDRRVVIGIFLGPPRANQKPVLQVLDRDGGLLGIAKIGLDPLTRRLGQNEADALTDLAGSDWSNLEVPKLLHFDRWRGNTVLVQSPLNLRAAPARVDPRVRVGAMRELATRNGVVMSSWDRSEYLARLQGRIASLGESGLVDRMRGVVREVACSKACITFGACHGDWTAWNMAIVGRRALVWDWERYERDVPLGFDELHFTFMPMLQSDDPGAAGLDLIRLAPRILQRVGVDPEDAKEICVLYLLDIGIRYLADRQSEAGARGGDVTRWLAPVLSAVGGRHIKVVRHDG